MNAAPKKRPEISTGVATSEAMVYSVLIHAVVLIIAAVGLPGLSRDPIQVAPPVVVELVDLDLITQTNKVSAPVKPEKKEEPKAQPKVEKKPTPPKVDSSQVPDLSKPSAPDLKPEKDVAEPIPEPEKLKALEKKPKPPPKKPTPPAKKKEAPKTNSFDSLLKNLTPDEDKAEEPDKKADEKFSSEKSQIAKLSEKLTISEEDALRHQLSQCWNVMAGAKYAEDLVVEVRVEMNIDRTVRSAAIMDKGRYNRDTHFRAAADAAIRALNNPRCSPLLLPPEKFEEWETIIITFDPRDML